MIGKTISHYKILEKLGEGGMAEVYRAEDLKLKRNVALKFLDKKLTSDPMAKRRFFHEARAASAVNHVNIATIYEIGEFQDGFFICMEYVEGKSLKQIIQQGTISLGEFFKVTFQIAEGLDAAHKKGIVHRDIKSDNIIITADGVVKITDFGLAKQKDATPITKTGTVLGTLQYMSPEQAQGKLSDHRSDIFSFGVVMYEMITGTLPFRGDYEQALFYSILNETPEPLARYKADVPDELQRIVSKALEKKVETRYQHMDDLLADLRRLKESQVIFPKPLIKSTIEGKGSQPPTLAVLYLDNMSGRKEDDYFVDGMTEDIITDLCSIEGIRVLSRSDVFPFRGKPINIKEIGKKLSVDYVLEGSVRKANNKLRVNAQLIKTADGFHVWAGRFDEELKHVFDLQAAVARKIAESLKVKLSRSELIQIEKKPTFSIQAYDYYLQGRDYYWKLGKEDIEFAIKMFNKALKIDPDYVLAYAGLADAYVYKYEAYFDRSLSILDNAEKASRKALIIDPSLPEAYRSLGRVYMFKNMTEQAINEFKKAIELRPNFYEAYRILGWLYEETRRYDDAIRSVQKALSIRPTDRESLLLMGITYFDQRLYDLALDSFNKAVDVAPDYSAAWYYIGSTFTKLGKFHLALERFQKCIDTGGDVNVWIDMGWAYLLKKDYQNAAKSFQKSIELNYFSFLAAYFLGLTFQLAKKPKKAENFYNKAVQLCTKQLKSDPNNSYLHSTLGLALQALGEMDKAEKEMKISMKLASENGAILCDFARFCAVNNQEKQTIKYLKRALELPLSPSKFEIRLDPHFENLHKISSFTNFIKT